jgi:hypothetical protein
VTALPRPLAPWAGPLAVLAPDLALALGEWARRVAPALGPMSGRRGGAGEPDGFAGLARRGPYERLLLTEWLLADEIPDEFIRRAAAGEHLFLERARRERASGRRSYALLDAGPDQLGAPRIAQLAALVVLAARAAAAGAEFFWGTVQQPERGLVGGFSADLARSFLEARSGEPPSGRLLARWADLVPPPSGRDDLWLVGGPRLAGPGAARFAAASRLLVDDVHEPGVRQVRLALSRPAAAAREVILDLPAGEASVRLLRDPFSTRSAAVAQVPSVARAPMPGRLVPEAGILFHPLGRRLAVRLVGGKVLDVPLTGPGRVVQVPSETIALGWRGGALVCVLVLGDGGRPVRPVSLRRLTGPEPSSDFGMRDDGVRPQLPRASHAFGPCACPFGDESIWFLDARGALFGAEERRSLCWAERLDVRCLLARGSQIAYLAGPRELELGIRGRGDEGAATRFAGGATRAFLAVPGNISLLSAGCDRTGLWTLASWYAFPEVSGGRVPGPDQHRILRPPPGASVVGVVDTGERPALVLVERHRKAFTLLHGNGLLREHDAIGEVIAAAVSPADATIAYTTRRGDLVVYSLERRRVLVHLEGRPA